MGKFTLKRCGPTARLNLRSVSLVTSDPTRVPWHGMQESKICDLMIWNVMHNSTSKSRERCGRCECLISAEVGRKATVAGEIVVIVLLPPSERGSLLSAVRVRTWARYRTSRDVRAWKDKQAIGTVDTVSIILGYSSDRMLRPPHSQIPGRVVVLG
ncbi:hypothetical protein LZ30DRAFT_463513 [Colletotrichum cereale]|nr:hypothetical protein LZ30DRAFT_463513 [Colletotrichum cereale]